MNVLVTGGAGYIGSVTVQRLLAEQHKVIVIDNLSTGRIEAVPKAVLNRCFVQSGIEKYPCFGDLLRDHEIEAVVHFAAAIKVNESVLEPAKYYDQNVLGTLNLLNGMRDANVKKIVFSSTAAVYGDSVSSRIPEDEQTLPLNPYGRTKLICEQMLADYALAYGLAPIALRYFNAAGASEDLKCGPSLRNPVHLITRALRVAAGTREHLDIYGDDYATPDGSCVRDYVHVEDIADAHCWALHELYPSQFRAFNIGTGEGHSVYEVIGTCRTVTGKEIKCKQAPRRPGDPASLVADVRKAREELKWEPRYKELADIVRSAWAWQMKESA